MKAKRLPPHAARHGTAQESPRRHVRQPTLDTRRLEEIEPCQSGGSASPVSGQGHSSQVRSAPAPEGRGKISTAGAADPLAQSSATSSSHSLAPTMPMPREVEDGVRVAISVNEPNGAAMTTVKSAKKPSRRYEHDQDLTFKVSARRTSCWLWLPPMGKSGADSEAYDKVVSRSDSRETATYRELVRTSPRRSDGDTPPQAGRASRGRGQGQLRRYAQSRRNRPLT